MRKSAAVTTVAGAHTPFYSFTATALLFERPPTKDEWEVIGRLVAYRHAGTTWALGDWLVEGGRQKITHADDGEWFAGGVYTEAARITGYSEEHLSNLYRVSKIFPVEDRDPDLQWGHHRAAAAVSARAERLQLLNLARLHDWTVTRFEQEIASRYPRKRPIAIGLGPAQVKCPHCTRIFPIQGNKVSRIARLREEETLP